MKIQNQSLKDKPIKKVSLKEGQQLTGKVVGLKNIDDQKAKLLMETNKEFLFLTIQINEAIKTLIRGQHVMISAEKQGLSIEPVEIKAIKLKRGM